MMIFIILSFYKLMIMRKLTLIKYLRNSAYSPANNDFTQIIIIKDVCHNKWARSLIRFKRS